MSRGNRKYVLLLTKGNTYIEREKEALRADFNQGDCRNLQMIEYKPVSTLNLNFLCIFSGASVKGQILTL